MPISMLDQIRTPHGRIPVVGAAIDGEDIAFSFPSPTDIAQRRRDDRGDAAPHEAGLEDVALVAPENVAALARRTGPLFGPSARERIVDWQSAAESARVAMAIQEAVNGAKPLSFADRAVAKTHAANPETGNEFDLYAISVPIARRESGYLACMPQLPWFRKFTDPDRFDYAFASVDDDADGAFLSIVLLSFSREITFSDFAAAASCFASGDAEAIMARASGDTALIERPLIAPRADQPLETRAEPIGESDVPALQRLVHALISLHTQGIAVDLFRASAEDGFLEFDTHLSYLWYRFSKGLDRVKIGYCEQCGAAFSLAGHRGIERRFCSESCKTQAKNARVKRRTDEARRMFADGASIEDIVRALYGRAPSRAQMGGVRKSIASWVELRHRVDADLKAGAGAPLARRCVEEGVYSEMRIAERMRALGITPRSRR